jgi:hypothetical protein
LLIDHTHRNWFIGSVISLVAATVVYVGYGVHSGKTPGGGSALGLTYGIAGLSFMVFAGLLGLRKKFPIWRVGRAQSWMRGHLWLGFLSFPMILFHGGFHFGGPLTRVMMWLFVFVFASGILGAALQHFIPRIHTAQLPMETIYEQIGRVRGQLAEEAVRLVEEACSALEGEVSHASELQRAASASAGTMGGLTGASGLQADAEVSTQLKHFLSAEMQPYLEGSGARRTSLSNSAQARTMFQQLRVLLPQSLHSSVDDLENICEEKRQLDRQSRLHRILHGWLLVHIPLSYGLLLLGAVHAVMALKF